MIKMENIGLKLGDLTIFKDMNISIKKGDVTLICGPNGTGKTLFFKLILKLINPNQGKIIVNGEDITYGDNIYENIGALVETPMFVEYYSGYDNMINLSKIRKKTTPEDILKLMKYFDLEKTSKPIKKYSLGMRQKYGIIQAIMEGQDLLLLDEPINSLDAASTKKVLDLIQKMKNDGKTIIIISHVDSRINEISDDVYMLKDHRFERLVDRNEDQDWGY